MSDFVEDPNWIKGFAHLMTLRARLIMQIHRLDDPSKAILLRFRWEMWLERQKEKLLDWVKE